MVHLEVYRMNNSIVEIVSNHVETNPEKPAVIVGKEIVSYQQLWWKTLAAARKLRSLDVRPKDRVRERPNRNIL